MCVSGKAEAWRRHIGRPWSWQFRAVGGSTTVNLTTHTASYVIGCCLSFEHIFSGSLVLESTERCQRAEFAVLYWSPQAWMDECNDQRGFP